MKQKENNMNNTLAPLHRLEFVQTLDSIFDRMLTTINPAFGKEFGVDFFQKESYPKVDVVDTDTSIIIEAEIPGLSKKDISVDMKDGVLTISGSKHQSNEDRDDEVTYIRKELKRSSFRRSFRLGDNLDTTKVDASFEDGLLSVKVPKTKPVQPESKVITIK
jgi:HSP20 family protein